MDVQERWKWVKVGMVAVIILCIITTVSYWLDIQAQHEVVKMLERCDVVEICKAASLWGASNA